MKTIFFSAIILLCNICVNSQSFRLGGSINILTGNKYLNYQFGPSLFADYSFKIIPISVQGSARFYLSELSGENNFSTGYTNNVLSVGVSVNYYPINWVIKPYIGVGAFYNSNNVSKSGTGDNTFTPSNVQNNFSGEISGGVKFSANRPINFIVEVTQTFNRPSYELVIRDPSSNERMIKSEKFNFSSLFVRLGLLFEI